MSYLSESFWTEGLQMDSSIFSDDDFFDWRWPASSPRRCDRESTHGISGTDQSTHQNYAPLASSCSCSNSNSNLEELFFYCTEELGSESTSGAGKNLSAYETDYMCLSTPQASSSGRCAYEDYNWAFKQQAYPSVSSSLIMSTSRKLAFEDAHSSSRKISSHAHTFHPAIAPHHHHHHCHTTPGGGNHGTFPPPIASLLTDRPLMRSFKSNGRFVLKKVDNVSRSLFHSTRENGHLRLDLLSYSFDRFESQYGILFPASASMPSALQDVPWGDSIRHDQNRDMGDISLSYQRYRYPSPYDSVLHHKPTLNYKVLCRPSKLQAVAMLMHPKGPCAPLVEESISTLSTSFQAEHLSKGQTGGNKAMVHPRPHIFALLKLLPSGLSLIIFEIRKSKGRDSVTVYGIYIVPKDFGFECGRASPNPGHHRLTGLCRVSCENPK